MLDFEQVDTGCYQAVFADLPTSKFLKIQICFFVVANELIPILNVLCKVAKEVKIVSSVANELTPIFNVLCE